MWHAAGCECKQTRSESLFETSQKNKNKSELKMSYNNFSLLLYKVLSKVALVLTMFLILCFVKNLDNIVVVSC